MAAPASATSYSQTNLVTDNQAILTGLGYTPAVSVDPNLVNPWGISHSATSPFWLSDNGTGLSTVYNSNGSILPVVETIPPAGSAPTGQIFNNTTDFKVGGASTNFIFATEGGTIAARVGGSPTATIVVDNSAAGAVYKGLAIGNDGSGNFLYAANFNSGKIDVFDTNFAPATLPGSLTDPNLPAGYAPFNVQVLNGALYVTYALQDSAKHDDVAGLGNGYVDKYDLSGNFIARVASNGPLDSPWGLDIAPAGFGEFANDLLVGNFGDGMIDAYNPVSDALLGSLDDELGNPIVIDGLWGLINGTGGVNGGDPNSVYFAAGLDNENDGLFGRLTAIPEPASLALLGAGLAALGAARRRKRALTAL